MTFYLRTLKRELLLHWRNLSDVLNPLVFFLVVITLFPLGLGPSPDQLSRAAPAVIWVAALLATLMSVSMMFHSDFDDGSLEQQLVSGRSMLLLVLAKVSAHWLVTGLPLVLLVPLVSLVMFVEGDGPGAMLLSLLLVSPTLSLLGAIGAALTVGLARGGLLVSVLVMPLYVPVLVLATAMVQAAISGDGIVGYVYWLGAILLLALGLAPPTIAASLRVAVER